MAPEFFPNTDLRVCEFQTHLFPPNLEFYPYISTDKLWKESIAASSEVLWAESTDPTTVGWAESNVSPNVLWDKSIAPTASTWEESTAPIITTWEES